MRLARTEEQEDLAAVVADLLAVRCPPQAIRAAADDPAALEPARAALAEAGAFGLLVAESAGGLGLDETYLVPLMEAVGYAGCPLPVGSTVAVGATVFAALGRADEVVGGDLVCADPEARGLASDAGQWVVSGGFAGRGPLRVLPLPRVGDVPAVTTVDPAARLIPYAVAGGDVELTCHEVLDDPAVVALAWRRGVLATAAELVGLSRRMLQLTVDYVSTREQFGAPIGSFQAVKHHLADAALAVEFAAPVVSAASALLAAGAAAAAAAGDAGAEVDRELAAAKALASDAAGLVARKALQCHGAMGYTTEYDLHLYAKRAWTLAAQWGSAAWHRAALADALGLPR